MKKSTRYKMRGARYENGSALILAVVLTSLLAIVGVLFLMASRVDRIATSAISQNSELDMAIDDVIARISRELALDVPHVDTDGVTPLQEYYDYPDEENTWLASHEPYMVGPGDYRWRYVSDIYSMLERGGMPYRPEGLAEVIPEYQDPAYVGDTSRLRTADADGDGVSDSVWVQLPNITSSKGWPVYAAVRVIDNGAMLNVNTAYKFDPCEPLLERIDGSSQMQINLMGLASRPGYPYTPSEETILLQERTGAGDALAYEWNVVWRYGEPNGLYTPFDISDELELRNRFLLNQSETYTRLKQLGAPTEWTRAFRSNTNLEVPIGTSSSTLGDWFQHANISANPDVYDYRHIATTYNMDRIISPDGREMLNINMATAADKDTLRDRITAALLYADPDFGGPGATAAQMAANLIDFRDDDEIVTAVVDNTVVPPKTYYGFERPCVYISELVHKHVLNPVLDITGESYAIELYKPYFEDNDPCDWRLVIDNSASSPPNDVYVPIIWSGTRRFHVIDWQDPNALISVGFLEPNSPNPFDGAMWVDPNVILSWPVRPRAASYDLYLGTGFEDVNGADSSDDEFLDNVSISDFNIIEHPDYPNGLEPETVYYWRIDDVNSPDTWKGKVWRFTTKPPGSGYSQTPQHVTSGWSPGIPVFDVGSIINLQRFVPEAGEYITVDSRPVPDWLVAGAGTHSFQRDITLHKCIRRLWSPDDKTPTLGHRNIFVDPNMIMIQAHPYLDPDVYGNDGFRNIGEIGMVFSRPAYYQVGDDPSLRVIGYSADADTEEEVRINLANPYFQQIFNYLTVFDPTTDLINNDSDRNADLSEIIDEDDINLDGYPEPGDELKIPGRININTAPWYVIAQLPWMTPEIAQAIVRYREYRRGLQSIGELKSDEVDELFAVDPVSSINYYGRADGPKVGDQTKFPDLTPEDGAADDLEERDLIFARISNLVTVRSDVFTAYILVRIGTDGPQKRVLAILDRSDVYADGAGGVTGSVRLRALHSVPDPR